MAQITDHSPLSSESLLEDVKRLIPELTSDKYKGQAGKVAVIGGCREYTGAPFFASYSALKAGADLAHVFCTEGAATVIKGYSPELIVHPYLPTNELASNANTSSSSTETQPVTITTSKILRMTRPRQTKEQLQQQQPAHQEQQAVSAILEWLDRFDILLVGPGLGRESHVLNVTYHVIAAARDRNIPIVVDADGLWLINQHPKLIQGYPLAVLTPNKIEFERLSGVLGIDYTEGNALREVCRELGGPVVVQKGPVDKIQGHINGGGDSGLYAECSEQGSFRRAGGQGDVLSGCIATFIAWARRGGHLQLGGNTASGNKNTDSDSGNSSKMLLTAAYGGCLVTRLASRAAFEKHGRAMGATDVIAELGRTVDSLVG